MIASKITLEQMLDARERRAFIQNELLKKYNLPLLCLTMNIAGEVKRTPLVKMLFDYGLHDENIGSLEIVEKKIIDDVTGCEAFLVINDDAKKIKNITVKIEESFPAARLFDYDVLLPNGNKLSREKERTCLVCTGPVTICSRNRAHGLEAIKKATDELLFSFFADEIAKDAMNSLCEEVYASPKPGLVDKNNNGAHKDMNISMFIDSATSLVPYFTKAIRLGIIDSGMQKLREAGINGEKEMFSATNGINTHKGMIYSLGLLLYGIGKEIVTGIDAIESATKLAQMDIEKELKNAKENPTTNGEKIYAKLGILGARGEAINGFVHAIYSYECLKKYYDIECPNAEALTLCDLMSEIDDTNIIHRGGVESLEYVKREAKRISSLPIDERVNELLKMDEEMIKRNLSPGGSADMLAIGLFLNKWNQRKLLFK